MSNQWLRLWHDMPNDPKWRTIARISGQPISLVLSVYLHLMVDASRNVTRGHADVTVEDMASALDVTDEQVEKIYSAMQGRVMEGNKLTGWEKRQPKREDSGDGESGAKSAAERKREQRERERLAQIELEKQQCHEVSRNVTLDTDKDKDTEEDKNKNKGARKSSPSRGTAAPVVSFSVECPVWVPADRWAAFVQMRKQIKKPLSQDAAELALSTLAKLKAEGHDPVECLNNSILNSWAGIFAPNRGITAKPATSLMEHNRAASAEAKRRLFGDMQEGVVYDAQ